MNWYLISRTRYKYVFNTDCPFNTISMIVLAITDVFGRVGRGTGGSPTKDEGISAVVGSAVGAILSFLARAVGFVAEHTWTLIAFVTGHISWC